MTDTPRSTVLPVLPLKSNVLFPNLLLPLAVGRKSSVAAVDAALLTEDKRLVIVAQRDPLLDEPKIDDLYKVGTLASIKKMERGDSGLQIIVQGVERVELIEAVETEPYFKLRVHVLPEPTDDGTEVEALVGPCSIRPPRSTSRIAARGPLHHPADVRAGARRAAPGLLAGVDAEPGHRQIAGAAGSQQPDRSIAPSAGTSHARVAGSRTAAKDRRARPSRS